MPQLDLFLFSSQCLTGLLFFSGYMFFIKVLLPYISFFIKSEEFNTLLFIDSMDIILESYIYLLSISTNIYKTKILVRKHLGFFIFKKFHYNILL